MTGRFWLTSICLSLISPFVFGLSPDTQGLPPSPPTLILPTGVTWDRMNTEIKWDAVRKLSVPDRPKISVVLGGGGARGLAHVGVLRVLEEEHIPIDEIVGVSVGALIGGLYASGVPIDDIERMASDIGWNKLTDLSKLRVFKLIMHEDLLSTGKMEQYLNMHIGNKFFNDLKIPFSCVATDLRTGEKVVFKEGSVALAARASATIPGVFKPVEYRQRLLVDGGIVDNLPTDLVQEDSQSFIIAVEVKPLFTKDDIPNVLLTLFRSIEVQGTVISQTHKRNADFVISPDVGDVGIAQLSRSKECVDSGVIKARQMALDLKKKVIEETIRRLQGKTR